MAATGSQSLGLPVGSPVMVPGAIVGVSIAGVALLILVFGTAWWWRRRMRRASRRNEVLPINAPSSKSLAASDRPLLIKPDSEGRTSHGNHHSPMSSTASTSTTGVITLESHSVARAPLPGDWRQHLPLETAPISPPPPLAAPMYIIPRLASPAPSVSGSRHPPRLAIPDHRPGPDGLTPLSPRPRRTPGFSMDGDVCVAGGRVASTADDASKTIIPTISPVYHQYR